MSILKIIKDYLGKSLYPKGMVPRELLDLHDYFRRYSSINFQYKKEGDSIVAISTNFRYGSIVTSAQTREELEKRIIDAIITSFELPSAYADEARIRKEDGAETQNAYALA